MRVLPAKAWGSEQTRHAGRPGLTPHEAASFCPHSPCSFGSRCPPRSGVMFISWDQQASGASPGAWKSISKAPPGRSCPGLFVTECGPNTGYAGAIFPPSWYLSLDPLLTHTQLGLQAALSSCSPSPSFPGIFLGTTEVLVSQARSFHLDIFRV